MDLKVVGASGSWFSKLNSGRVKDLVGICNQPANRRRKVLIFPVEILCAERGEEQFSATYTDVVPGGQFHDSQ